MGYRVVVQFAIDTDDEEAAITTLERLLSQPGIDEAVVIATTETARPTLAVTKLNRLPTDVIAGDHHSA